MDRTLLLNMLHDGECEITFTKVNGERRVMRCTLEFATITARFGLDDTGNNNQRSPKVITVLDLDKDEWRCFKPETVTTCEAMILA